MKEFKEYFFEDEEEFREWFLYIGKLALFLIIGTMMMLIIKDIIL